MRKILLAAALAGTTMSGLACAQTAPKAPPAPARGMARADSDGDGRISKAEFIARADTRFAKLDKNGDGQLSSDEMPQRPTMALPAPPPGADAPPPPPPPSTGGPMRERMREKMRSRMIDRLDTNHDGMISRDEYRAQAAERFDHMDSNHDGFVDASERAAMRDRMGGMMQHGGDMPPPPPQNPGQ
ncbi:EF-hand domain-containing protein [Sphingomonas sp. AR_OL41]|uniref:EF-hand domain-containing protein n=1 Tax=Sphingomonas sp. AR_OL41 TaxID=3042729 RepID=UPI0024804CD8|nr:EF-hand domain-containing protein [Sphingomonas sp. AR_OL41]MDH7973542.1 EF-hand domain-containing protein [Sphingomonas sp. AR_OL41]